VPIYEYECKKCHHRFEKIQKVSDPPIRKCPECGGSRVEKLMSSPAVHFKGSGWYVTDYARKGTAGKGKEGKSGKESKESGSKGSAGDSSSDSTSTSTKSKDTDKKKN